MNLSQLSGISIAAAGAINLDKGLITSSPNLPGWHDVPLRDIIKEKYGVNTFLINDASAAALGEHWLGAGRGVSNLIYLTVSTGIGGGIIINGRLYSGESGSAVASGTAVAKEAIRRISQGERSSITEIVGGKIEDITAEEVGAAAQKGDALALEVVSQAATYLGVGMVNLVNIFNPEMIIVGGGVSKMGDLLLNPARQVVKERAFQLSAQAVRIVPAQLGEDGGVLGAAVFAFEQESD